VYPYEGDSFEFLEAAFHKAVDDYLETMAELNLEPEKPHGVSLFQS